MSCILPFFGVDSKELPDFQAGSVILVGKPSAWTSFDVVNKIRSVLRTVLGVKKIKVGHAGTLDPMATGLLIVCTGKATKSIVHFQDMPKTYVGTLSLGASTPSYDAETEVDVHYPIDHIDESMLESVRKKFVGRIAQLPPMFSAVKVKGQPLYKLARKGRTVERKARVVEVYDFAFRQIDLPRVDFYVRCSKGTYIRSLVHDFGRALNSGAYLTALSRTAIGPYQLEQAWNLENLVERLQEAGGKT